MVIILFAVLAVAAGLTFILSVGQWQFENRCPFFGGALPAICRTVGQCREFSKPKRCGRCRPRAR
jgi:uncharacterized ion transporter superfamily protein YfcC